MSAAVSPEEFKKHLRVYWVIFFALICLTVLTVGIAYFHLFPFHIAVIIAMIVASTKATLVALYFMHLIDEKKIIYATLGVTASTFVIVMAISFFLLH